MTYPCVQCQKPEANKPGGYCNICREVVKRAGMMMTKRAHFPMDRDDSNKSNGYKRRISRNED